MRPLLVELDRFRSRRAVVLILVAGALLIGWMAGSTIWDTRPVSATEAAAAEAQVEQEREFAQERYERCLEEPEHEFGPGATPDMCFLEDPQLEWFLHRSPLSVEEELGDTGLGALLLLAGLGIVVGATFAGADWASGSMANQLLFRPRRIAVWSAKAAAVTLGFTAVSAVLIAGLWAAYLVTTEVRGIGHSTGFVRELVALNGRGLVLVAGAALGGFALSMLLRSTVGTLALVFAYSVGGEAIVASLPFERVSRFSLSQNVLAWLRDGLEVFDQTIPCAGPAGMECQQSYLLSGVHGATYLAVLLVLAVALSLLAFRQRDIA